jgi:DNA-directed RNA polymerase specialized sigma24 family protein
MRKHHTRPLPLEIVPDLADNGETADDTLQQKARFVALQTALLALPERQRQAVESLISRGKHALTKLSISRQAELGFQND